MGALLDIPRHKLTVDDYHRMAQAGIFHDGSRVELVEGELIDMAPIGSLHASVVTSLSMFFARNVGDHAIVSTQNSVSLPPDSEPQPDIMLLRPRADRYRDALPASTNVLLLIEVSDTTLAYDRDVKLPLYARHGIPEVWLIDLKGEQLEIHLEPDAHGYRKILRPERRETIAPTRVHVRFPLSEIWPD